MTGDAGRLRFCYFTSFTPAGPPGAQWNNPDGVKFNYLDVDHWIKFAAALEAAKFDAVFFADHSGVHDVYQGSYATAVREAVQFPSGDPMTLTAALASSTRDLGFVFSANVIQEQPYAFARRVSSLDHLTRGRVAWNVVTSFQRSAWQNLGFDDMANHADRYERAEEFLTVVYKLLEGSWEEGAVVRDEVNAIYADPSKVHPIEHRGKHFSVPGIHVSEPSPQRLPFLFQAGSSDSGRDFSARNAESIFVTALNPAGARKTISDMQTRLEASSRLSSDLLFFIGTNIIVGSTEEEARRKSAEVDEMLSSEALLAFGSSTMGVDLSQIDLDSPVGEFKTEALQGQFRAIAEAAPDKSWTFREVVKGILTKRIAGTPEQIADRLEEWRAAGVHGINLGTLTGPFGILEFTEHVVPTLQERGLMQREYTQGTFREKITAGTSNAAGRWVNDRHPAARFRRVTKP
ncbi:NtaA/DmoA family FMN-dependent monooxygenase [Pseudarthrobacter sp. fls2-241-R2A-168]|uniref:NtaA/DmoA family FMN-dependent monooxygenase n=1 Tax=Pseudarthrobacter sp. fls2-241-R2A-168 TaxID=3040304 RepID=UPI002553ECC1|nr:NtaA/DmoA family FMN-dependent monooxygenase [Pseudarthrobacter sp. fls2-241-R2A-168]